MSLIGTVFSSSKQRSCPRDQQSPKSVFGNSVTWSLDCQLHQAAWPLCGTKRLKYQNGAREELKFSEKPRSEYQRPRSPSTRPTDHRIAPLPSHQVAVVPVARHQQNLPNRLNLDLLLPRYQAFSAVGSSRNGTVLLRRCCATMDVIAFNIGLPRPTTRKKRLRLGSPVSRFFATS